MIPSRNLYIYKVTKSILDPDRVTVFQDEPLNLSTPNTGYNEHNFEFCFANFLPVFLKINPLGTLSGGRCINRVGLERK